MFKPTRRDYALAAGGLVLLGAHVVALHRLASRFALPLAAILAVAIVIAATHTGALARLRDHVRGRS